MHPLVVGDPESQQQGVVVRIDRDAVEGFVVGIDRDVVVVDAFSTGVDAPEPAIATSTAGVVIVRYAGTSAAVTTGVP